jgi:predicted nucleotidyltransferase
MIDEARLADAIDAVIYADVFGSAVSLENARRFARAPLAEIGELDDPRLDAVLVARDGGIALRPREEHLASHGREVDRAACLARRAERVARVLRHAPFVRGIALTGSVAAGSADGDADVDLLVIAADGRVGTVFLALAPASRLLGRKLFCPNLYLTESSIAIEPDSPYVEREVAQTRMLVGPANVLRHANPWLATVFPNLDLEGPTVGGGGRMQRTLERIVGGRLEGWARRLAVRRLDAHYGGRAPEDVVARLRTGEALRFHRGDLANTVPRRYERRRSEVEAALARARSR